ncbi:MAG: Ig-like domain-containing protein [Bacteroidales bacterium]|nr:Ig-like domain-containing protein [Candidatus Equibacterium intestinale]
MIMRGGFTYRFYLGGNQTSDFSVYRNMHYVIRVSLTDTGALGSDWRVDSDIHTIPISSLNIYPEAYTFDGTGLTTDLIAYVSPTSSERYDVIWSSSNPSVATVDNDGGVTSVGYGTAIITATLAEHSRFSATCTITVNGGTGPVVPVNPPVVSPISEVFAESSEYYVALNDTIHVNTFLKRENGSIEPIYSRFFYDMSSTGSGFAISPEENVIQGEGLGDVKMYFTYDGHRSPSITVHVTDPNSHTHIFN